MIIGCAHAMPLVSFLARYCLLTTPNRQSHASVALACHTLLILNGMATSRKTSSAGQASGAHMQTLEGWASQDVFLEDLQAVQLVEVLIGLIALQLGHRLAPGSVHLQGPLNPSLQL